MRSVQEEKRNGQVVGQGMMKAWDNVANNLVAQKVVG